MNALADLAFDSPEHSAAIIATGCLPRLVSRLAGTSQPQHADAAAAREACGALISLVGAGGPEAAAAAVEAGVVPALVAQLHAHSSTDDDDDHILLQQVPRLLYLLVGAGQSQVVLRARVIAPLGRLRRDSPSLLVQERALDALRCLGAVAEDLPLSSKRAPKMCAACCATEVPLRCCASCGRARYCSQACQHEHWSAHRPACRRLQAEKAAASQPGVMDAW